MTGISKSCNKSRHDQHSLLRWPTSAITFMEDRQVAKLSCPSSKCWCRCPSLSINETWRKRWAREQLRTSPDTRYWNKDMASTSPNCSNFTNDTSGYWCFVLIAALIAGMAITAAFIAGYIQFGKYATDMSANCRHINRQKLVGANCSTSRHIRNCCTALLGTMHLVRPHNVDESTTVMSLNRNIWTGYNLAYPAFIF